MSKSGLFKKLFSKNAVQEEMLLSEIVEQNEEILNSYDKKMILNIIDMSTITVKEIMIPRVEVVSIDKNLEIEEIIQIIVDKGRSRLPVFDNNIDNIIGILHSKELLTYFTKKSDFDISKVIRLPLFIPETKNINDLLLELREKKVHLAIVVDEFGGMSGVISLEDIIERIVGKIEDEFDNETANIIKIDDRKYLVEGRTTIEELNEVLNTDFDDEEVDTLGGLIYILFGRIPAKNDKIEFKNCLFTIESISIRKIKKVMIELLNYKEAD